MSNYQRVRTKSHQGGWETFLSEQFNSDLSAAKKFGQINRTATKCMCNLHAVWVCPKRGNPMKYCIYRGSDDGPSHLEAYPLCQTPI